MNARVKVLEREAASAALNPLIPANVRAALAEAVALLREHEERADRIERDIASIAADIRTIYASLP